MPSKPAGLSVRAAAIGVVCVAAVSVIVTLSELIVASIRLGYLALPPVSLAVLMIVLWCGRGLSRILRGRFALAKHELITVYVMCLVGAMVSSHGLLQKIFPLLVTPNYDANKSNNWARLFFPNIPHWIVPWNPAGIAKQDVAKFFYERLPNGAAVPWHAWVVPLVVWGGFFALVIFCFLCLAAIVQRQWIANEKLTFPLVQLPLEMIEGVDSAGKPLARNPLIWIGIAVPVVIYSIDWLHQFQPTVPNIPLAFDLGQSLGGAGRPWNQIDATLLVFSSAAIGFFYLLPTDILLSIWFFFILCRVQQMVAVQFDMDTPRMPKQDVFLFQGYQSMAAYFVLVGYFVWIARRHLRSVWREATGKPSQPGAEVPGYKLKECPSGTEERNKATGASAGSSNKLNVDNRERDVLSSSLLPMRVAVWGLFGALVAAAGMLVAMGMSPMFAVLEMVASVVVIGLVMARSTAEAGMLMTEVTWAPVDVYALFGSVHALGPQTLTIAAFADHAVAHDQRGLLLCGMLDSAKLGEGANMRGRSILGALALGIVIAIAVAGPLQLVLPYTWGGQKMDYWMENLSPQSQFLRYAAAMTPPAAGQTTASWQAPLFFAIGAVVTLFLTAMRSAFYWWPLHPLGYALAGSFSTILFWFPCLIAWLLKSLTLRYFGIGGFQRARPFFLGLILGEFGMAFLAGLVTVIAFMASHGHYRIPTPPFPWY